MSLITWSDSYSVKNMQMDDQHRKLVDLINDLHGAMKLGQGRQKLGTILDALVDYTRTHFRSEELLMKTHGYPGYEDQKKAHEELVAKVEDIQSRHREGVGVISQDVMSFLKDWLVHHIQGMDQQYGTYLQQKGVA